MNAAPQPAALSVAPVTVCAHCARSEGLKQRTVVGAYLVTGCDCNYQHVQALPVVPLPLPGETP